MLPFKSCSWRTSRARRLGRNWTRSWPASHSFLRSMIVRYERIHEQKPTSDDPLRTVPPPSTDEAAWWDDPGDFSHIARRVWNVSQALADHPNGIVIPNVRRNDLHARSSNPFDSSSESSLSSSPSSSEEELYHALSLQPPITPAQPPPVTTTQRRPAPPPPTRAIKPAPETEEL